MALKKGTSQKVSEQFGNALISAVREFAYKKIADPATLDTKWFEHVRDANVRNAISDTYYGARWLYRIGLALLVEDKERFAHVRAQVIDYGSICETLLAEMILHGLNRNKFTGNQYKYKDDVTRVSSPKSINWGNFGTLRAGVERQKFWWYIAVAKEEIIVDNRLAIKLNKLRDMRNTVHLTEKINSRSTYSLDESAIALETLQETINQTKSWFYKHL